MNENFDTDARRLNVMLIIELLLEFGFGIIVGGLLYGFKVSEDLASIFSAMVATFFATYYIVRKYQKKLALKISYKISDDFSISSYIKYAIMALGAGWFASLLMSLLMENLSSIIILDTPDFTAHYDLLTNITLIIYTIIVAPITEELLFRGIMLNKLKQYNKIYAIIIVSMVFGLLHGNLPQTIPTFIISIFLCLITLKSGSILPAVSIHMINNGVAQITNINNDVFNLISDIIIIVVIVVAVILMIKEFKNRGKYNLEYRIKDYFNNWAGILILIFAIISLLGSIVIV